MSKTTYRIRPLVWTNVGLSWGVQTVVGGYSYTIRPHRGTTYILNWEWKQLGQPASTVKTLKARAEEHFETFLAGELLLKVGR